MLNFKPKTTNNMRKKATLFVVFSAVSLMASFAETNSLTVRIKAMRCEECAHKVNKALRSNEGVENVTFDLEKRTATIEYDGSKVSATDLEALLVATGRYKPSPYDPTEKIRRAMGLKTEELQTAADSARIMEGLWSISGMDSVAPRLDKRYVFVRYDANKTTKAIVRQKLVEIGFTPVAYYTSNDISHAYIKIPAAAATEATIEEVMTLEGVDDVNVNPKLCTLAITYINKETTEEKLSQQVKEIVGK